MKDKQKGESALFSATILYGFFGIFSKLINFQLPIFYQAWVRNVFAFIVLGVVMILFKKWKPISLKDNVWFFFRSACGFVSFIGMYVAFTKLDIGTTYFLSYAASIVAGYVLGIFLFKEKITRYGILAFVLSLMGLILVYKVDINSATFRYIVLAVLSGLASPGWGAFSKKISSTYYNLELNFIDSLYAAAFPFVISLFIHEQWVPISFTKIWIYTFLFGLMFIVNGLLIVYGYSKVEAQTGTIILLFEIIVGIILGYVVFHQVPPLGGFIGGGIILGAILLRSFNKESAQ